MASAILLASQSADDDQISMLIPSFGSEETNSPRSVLRLWLAPLNCRLITGEQIRLQKPAFNDKLAFNVCN